MKTRLNARCQDLLEVTTITKPTSTSARKAIIKTTNRTCIQSLDGRFPAPEDFSIYQVNFLHRTVRDFLETKEMQELLASRLPKGFDPIKLLCGSFLQQIK